MLGCYLCGHECDSVAERVLSLIKVNKGSALTVLIIVSKYRMRGRLENFKKIETQLDEPENKVTEILLLIIELYEMRLV
jgi:hypothetical protein